MKGRFEMSSTICAPIEEPVERQPSAEMQTNVEECEKPEHAPEADELRQAQDLAKRRDGQRQREKSQNPIAGRVLDVLDRIQREIVMKTLQDKDPEWNQAQREDNYLRPLAGQNRVHRRVLRSTNKVSSIS